MPHIHLIHWHVTEAQERAACLWGWGYEVACDLPTEQAFLRAWGEHPPDAVVIDLARVPSHGRDVALALRLRKSTRHIPLLFVGGDACASFCPTLPTPPGTRSIPH